MAIKPVWGPTPEQVANDKLNQMVEFSEALAGVGTLFRAADPQPAGLSYAYLAGRIRKADGTIIEVAAGSVVLTAEATNYIEVDDEGNVSRNTLAFTDFRRPIAIVETDEGSVTTRTDARVNFDFGAGGGADINLAWEGPWETAIDYAEGDIVQNGSPVSSYRCTSSHTSATLTEPGAGADWADVWEVIAQAGGQGPQGNPGTPGASLNWRSDWVNNTAYAVNDGVTDGTVKSSYRCHTAHTSSGASRPGLGASWTSYWHYVAQAGSTGAPGAAGAPGINGMVWQGEWDSVTTYAENDGVRADGSTYICTAANTNQEPPNALYWDLVAPKGDTGEQGPPGGSMDWHELWEDGAGYVENDAVPHGDPVSSYRCKADHTATSTNEPGTGVDWEDYWIKFAGGGSDDANTLEGEDGAHYLDRSNHTGAQAISTVTGLQTALDGKAAASHTHAISNVTGLQTALDGKAALSHTHSISDVTGLADALDELGEAVLPPVGTEGQVLTVESGNAVWADPTGGGGGGHEIQSEGTPLAQQPALNFTGAGVTVTDDAPNNATIVNIPAGIGAGFAAETTAEITGDQSIANSTLTDISFDALAVDVGLGFNWSDDEPTKIYATDFFTCIANIVVEFYGNNTGYRSIYLTKNGDTLDQRTVAAIATDETRVGLSHIVQLEPGDYISVAVRQNSGGALAIRTVSNAQLVRLAPQAGVDASKIQGIDVADTTPANGQVLAYNSTANEYQPVAQSGGGDVSLTPNRFKTLRFDAAPALMEFGIEIGDGTDPVILTGAMNAGQIKAAIEASADMAGYTANVVGLTLTAEGDDGVDLHSGKFVVAMNGEAPFPAWSSVKNSEVQALVVGDGAAAVCTVTGPGDSNYEGDYPAAGELNNKPMFRLAPNKEIYWTGGQWNMGSRESGTAAYYNDTNTPFPPEAGWTANTGTSPAPSVTVSGICELNDAGEFLVPDSSASKLQAQQRALGGAYASVNVRALNYYRNLLEGSTISHDSGVYAGIIDSVIDNNDANGIWFTGSVNIILDRGPNAPEIEVGSIYTYTAATTEEITTSADGATYGSALGVGDTLKRFVKFYLTRGEGPVVQEIRILGAEPYAVFHSYFPYGVGDVSNPSATGTDVAASTLYEGGSASTVVVMADATIDELLIAGLISPETSEEPTDEYEPANPSHWAGTPPTTLAAATDRIAAHIYNYFWEPIP